MPDSDDVDFCCRYGITGLGAEINHHAYGCGGIQALCLALVGIGSKLYLSEEFKSGRLTRFEGRNLGFPMFADTAPADGIEHAMNLLL